MRRHLTTGIKAILAVAALTTGAHWAMRLQREPTALIAGIPSIAGDPVTTGSIAPAQTGREPAEIAAAPELHGFDQSHFDQSHLAKLFSDVAAPKAATRILAGR